MKKHIFSALGLLTFLLAATLLLTACGSMKTTCTVTFNSNGGSEVPAQRVAKGEKMEKPEDPQKTGYAFSGWTFQGEAWSFVGYTVTENMTLDAVWTPVTYTITYDLAGGTNEASNPTTYTVESDTITFAEPSRTGYIFVGWDHSSIPSGSTGNKTITASWMSNPFVVSGNTITGLNKEGEKLANLVIPSQIDGVSITSIGDEAFRGRTGLTSVTIPDSVTRIGWYAFSGCKGLTSVTIGNGVTSIGSSAFQNCTGLTSVTIPDSVTSIGEYAFDRCSGLTSVTIGNGVTSIGSSAFGGCTGLTSVTIPDCVTSIGDFAFSCYHLVEVRNLSALNITAGSYDYGYAGYYAKRVYKDGESYLHTTDDGFVFYDDGTNVWLVGYNGTETDLTLPTSYNGKQYAINQYAFSNCTGLTSVTIPDSVTSIGNSAFEECTGLTSVTIPDSVTSIGDRAFQNCTGLTSVTIGNSVTSIEGSAFRGCTGLTSVMIGNGVTSIGNSVFSGCTGLTSVTIPDSVTSIGDGAFFLCKGLASVTIPDSVTSIGSHAFYWCTGLTSVTIGNGVMSIGNGAFSYCTGLTAVYITNLAKWCGISFDDAYANPLYEARNLYLNGKLVTDLVIDSVTSIGEYAFFLCKGLASVTISDSVTSIGNSAFYGCTGLTSITIPNSVTSIGNSAFYGCTGLTSITFTGTKAQWNAISKVSGWNSNTGSYTIHCTDGNITK